ncbi:hypothetical protein JKP88DRAFT_182463, partial [Tribonema minus]
MDPTPGELRIGVGVRFRGDVSNCRHAVLEGQLSGFLEAHAILVKPAGSLGGDARCHDADIAGTLKGSLECLGELSIRTSGNIVADVMFEELCVQRGAWLEG